MIDLLKKTMLAGVGAAIVTREKVESALEDYVKQGKVSAQDAKIMAEKIADQGRKEFDDLATEINTKFQSAFDTKSKEMANRVTALEARVGVLEHKLAAEITRSSEP